MKKITKIIFSSLILLNIGFYSKAMVPKAPAVSATQKLAQANKGLVEANKAYADAKTPEEKKLARKRILREAQEVLKITTAHRNIQGELMGYQDEEAEAAQDVLEEKTTKRDVLKKIVDDLKKERATLENKGWIWNSVKTGKEKEHARITKKINKLEPTLKELNADVREQEIIAGKNPYTKTRAFAVASLAAVMTASGLYMYLGPVAAKAEYDSFKSNPRQYFLDRASSFKNWFGGLLGTSATPVLNQALLENADTILASLNNESLATKFSKGLISSVTGTIAMAKDMAVQMTMSATVSTALGIALQRIKALLDDPNTTKEQLEAEEKEIKNIVTKSAPTKK